ncbi:MAG: hypothetical protein JOZ62_17580, partial [Acidobacteriaceae bacterium]|nr:hypothetical protein [Acidobacteriaceae bacterium]
MCTASLLSAQLPNIGGCQIFPSNNVWNTRIDSLPLDPNSSAYVSTIGPSSPAHPDFGQDWGNGIPYVVVPQNQPGVLIEHSNYGADPGPYPIPPNPPIEGGAQSDGDRHVLVVQQGTCKLYELFSAYPLPDGNWVVGSAAIFDLNSNQLRPTDQSSADAAGLPILPGLVRYDEVESGVINHALRFTAPMTAAYFVWPARSWASSLSGSQYPPMGQRFRLKASFDISSFPQRVQVILQALKTYGMILADNGASWFISGVPDPRWNDDEMHQLTRVHGSDFEAVDESSLMIDPNSGQAGGS